MSMIRQNVTLDPEVYDKFCEIASKKGIKTSAWVNAKMIEFIEIQSRDDEWFRDAGVTRPKKEEEENK